MTSKARGRKKRPLEHIHPNAPKRLVREYKKLGCNQLALAKQLRVNDFYINRLLKDGVAPSNPEIRKKLFLRVPNNKPRPKRIQEMSPTELLFALNNREEMK